MKALVKFSNSPGDLEIREIKEPVCSPREVKVEVKACGVCGTDIHIMHDLYPWELFLPLGHEYSGMVVDIGKNVKNFNVGDRVTGGGTGGFAKYLVIEEDDHIYKLPDTLSFEEGALFELLSGCVYAVLYLSGITPMDVVLITGPGPIGLCTMQASKAMGAIVIITGTSIDNNRLKLAKELGADYIVNVEGEDPEEFIRSLTDDQEVDAVLECSGSQSAVDLGIKVIKPGKKITQIGLFGKRVSIDLDRVVYRDLRIVSAIVFTRDSWLKSIALVSQKKINLKKLISHKLPLSEWKRGFEICEKKEGFKVLLSPE
jgi:L-iditol 2-dehydrogenase